jgi:hypothetical protein
MAKLELSDTKKKEIQDFLILRFAYLQELRQPFDKEISEEVDIFNNIDKNIDGKKEWEEKYKIPYVYTIIQTMCARVIGGLFGQQNYLKVFTEDEKFLDVEGDIAKWIQGELDKIKLKSRARDFIESALSKRLSWLQLRPNLDKEKRKLKIEFDVLDFYSVWFDLKAKNVMDTDFFVRKVKKFYQIKTKPDLYFNLDGLSPFESEDDDSTRRKKEYKAKHSGSDIRPDYKDFETPNNATDEIECLEYYGIYDLSEEDINDKNYKGDFKEVIFTLANRKTLIRAETNELETKKKRLLFPIRPLRQADSLIGKGVGQLIKDLAKELNEARSLRMDNFKTLIKLLFKYDKNADIDIDEIYAGAGNAMGYDGVNNKNAIDTFNVPNLVGIASQMGGEITQDMQQVTGAVDYVMGTSAGRGFTETASGIRSITEQAMFKFSMMAENVYDDVLDFINFISILFVKYAPNEILLRHPKLQLLIDETPEELEESYIFDIELKDISQRRDVERHQWANMLGILEPMVERTGGNIQELLKQFMAVFQVPNAEKILQKESPEAMVAKLLGNPQLLQAVMTAVAQAQAAQAEGGGRAETQAEGVPGGGIEEKMANENLVGDGGGAG